MGVDVAVLGVTTGLSVTCAFDVYTPQSVTLSVEDSTLNRFTGLDGQPIVSCTAEKSTASPYQ